MIRSIGPCWAYQKRVLNSCSKRLLSLSSLLFGAFFSCFLSASPLDVQVQALFPGAAMLTIEGQRHLLRAGQRSPEGVLLKSASSENAALEYAGLQRDMGLTHRVGTATRTPRSASLGIPRSPDGTYRVDAWLNGRRVSAVVDTGASQVALSESLARRLGLAVRDGESGGEGGAKPIELMTASGPVSAKQGLARSVRVAGLEVSNVQVAILPGDYPRDVLLGMSYLRHLRLREQGGVLLLQRRN